MRRSVRRGALAWTLVCAAIAHAEEPLTTSPFPSRASAATDAGVARERRRPEQPLSEEDRELVQHLELLEMLEETGDLDVLLELAQEDR